MNNQFDFDVCLVKVIDPIKKQVIGHYHSYVDASVKLDMSAMTIRTIAHTKTKRFCKKLNKDILVRVVSKTKAGAI